jgi:tetratricopeptide (TPR) repeat protein
MIMRCAALALALIAASCGRQLLPSQRLLDPEAAVAACTAADSFAEPARTVDLCSIVVDANPPIATGEKLTDALVSRGVAFRNLNQLEKSKRDLERSVSLSPRSAEALRMLAWTLREMKDYDTADKLYSDAIAIEDDWQARLSRCVIRGSSMGRWQDAVADCRIAHEKSPNADSYYFLADALHHAGRLEEAVEIARAGIAQPDAEQRTIEELANLLTALGRADEAADVLKAAQTRHEPDRGEHP